MKKDEIIAFLQQLVESQKLQLESQKHLLESQNRQIDDLLRQVASLTDEVASLKVLLVQKGEEEEKTKRALKVLGKLNRNKSEKQTPPAQETETPGNNNNTATEESHGKKERPHTNNGAKRKVYYDIETVIKDVYPDDPAFDSQMASHIGFDEVVRYELVPMKFRKVIYRVHKYSQRGVLMEGKTPMAPFLNSNYDGSFIAGISHLRFMYSMPVERIVKYFGENGFDMPKQTAHGLLAKTENLFEKLNEALKMTVKTDSYGCADETYHKILVKEKNKDGKGIKNGYIWGFLAVNLGLVYFFYCCGSRGGGCIFRIHTQVYGSLPVRRLQDIQERGEMVPQTCMFPTCEKEVPRLWRRLRLQGDSQADKLHLPSGPQAQNRTGRVDRGQAQKMEEGHVQADNENHKEKARPDGSRQDDTAKDGEI